MFQQAPLLNASTSGYQVYSHSGEFSPQVVDVTIPGRGVSFQFIRKYRSSRHKEIDSLGHGWTFTYAKRLEREGKDILYHDGEGRIHRFTHQPGKNHYRSPNGLYSVLVGKNEKIENEKFALRQRFGTTYKFAEPEDGGHLLAIEDRNGNALNFTYVKDALQVTDPLGHQITLTFHHQRVIQVQDHANRIWHYTYNEHDCLIEVIQPPTDDFPGGSRLLYDYDEAFRLISITDAKGQTFLRNTYDKQSRIMRQEHGNGVFQFQYENIGTTKHEATHKADDSFPIYRTHVQQKNGAQLLLTHDATGQVVERTLFVSAASLAAEDRHGSTNDMIALTTISKFNHHGEFIERIYPAGNRKTWEYDERQADPRAQGNALKVVYKPSPDAESDQEQIISLSTYEPQYQRLRSLTDARGYTTRFEYDSRGNLIQKIFPPVTIQQVETDQAGKHSTQMKQLVEQFEYNVAGQVIRAIDPRGAIIEYSYYPANDPSGANGLQHIHNDAQQAGGYVARVVRDPANQDHHLKSKPASLVTELQYDIRGNITAIVDGKSNPTRLKYDTHNRLIGITSRQPFDHQLAIRRDVSGNRVETTLSFDHFEYDPAQDKVIPKSSTIRQVREFNILNHTIRRTVSIDGHDLTATATRDANENVTRMVQPLGNATEYTYDERNLLLESRLGVGAKEEITVRYTHTPNGRRRTFTDGRGNTMHYHYDGFHRYRGLANAVGTTRKLKYDAVGNIMRDEVSGDIALVNEQGQVDAAKMVTLFEAVHQYDELNRRIRTNRAWRDLATGAPLGKSQWDGQDGEVTTVIEYDDNHLPLKTWDEAGNVRSMEYDGANQLIASRDATGESVSIDYDENGNSIRFERLGPEVDQGAERFHQVITRQFDALDRLIARTVNEDPPEALAYNALGHVIAYTDQAGAETQFLHDAFGRPTGYATTAITPPTLQSGQHEQILLRQVERDDNSRAVARINAAGHRTQYHYDALNRPTAITYPDGTTKQFERDGKGNITRIADPNGNVIVQSFDPLSRLVERRIEQPNGGDPQVEQFHYNGLNRMVAAITSGATSVRRFDSLSRVLEEAQTGRTIRYGYDSVGNRTHLTYPGGQEVHKVYDVIRRLSEVRDGANNLIAQYTYRSRRQRKQQRLGTVLEASYTYTPDQSHLSDITYRSTQDGSVVDGYLYRYDVVGNRTQEVQLHSGDAFGERYVYDSANRLIDVQYGVENLDDPSSRFDHEVQYDLSSVSTWQQQTTLDSQGRILFQLKGNTNQRDVYLSLGDRRFEYDANGNRSFETNNPDSTCSNKRYTYDYANRLVKVECVAADGSVNQTIEYAYDAFNRQVFKRLSDAQGTREITRIWKGNQLIEEWEGDQLVRSFIYGARVKEPVKINRYTPSGVEEFFYTLNGRGSVSALVTPTGLVAERYTYDVFGQPFLSEVNGVPVPPVEIGGQPSFSPVNNPFFTGAQLWDSDTRLLFNQGVAFDPSTRQTVGEAPFDDTPFIPLETPPPYDPNSDMPIESTGIGPLLLPVSVVQAVWETLGVETFKELLNEVILPEIIEEGGETIGEWGIDNIGDITSEEPSSSEETADDTPEAGAAPVDGGTPPGGAPPDSQGTSSEAASQTSTGQSQAADPNAGQNQSVDPNAGQNQSVDPNAGQNQSVDPNAGQNQSVDPNAGQNQSVDPNTGQNQSVDPNAGQNQSVDPNAGQNQSTDSGSTQGSSSGSSGVISDAGGSSSDAGVGDSGLGGGADGGFGVGGCFVRGTLVATKRGLLPIEQVQVADDIYAYDLKLEDHTIQRVEKTFEAEREEILVLDFGAEKIRCTPAHRFYTGKWVPAKELSLGELVLSLDGRWKELKGIGREIQTQLVFNLKVAEMHNYFVGQSGLLVHNDKSATGGDPETSNQASE